MTKRFETALVAVLAVLCAVLLWYNIQPASAASSPKVPLRSTEFGVWNEGVVSDTLRVEIYAGVSPTGTLVYATSRSIEPGTALFTTMRYISSLPANLRGYALVYADQPVSVQYYVHATSLEGARIHNLTDKAGYFHMMYMWENAVIQQDGLFSIAADQEVALTDVSQPPQFAYDDIIVAADVYIETYQAEMVEMVVK